MLKIFYISSSVIPSRAANSIHVMKMCQALSFNGHSVVLSSIYKDDLIEAGVKDIYSYYGVESNFTMLNIPWSKKVGHKAAAIIYALKASLAAKRSSADLVFCRNLMGAFISCMLGKKVIFESHSPVDNNSALNGVLFRALLKCKNLSKIVVISNALKGYYSNRYGIKDSLLVLAPDAADEVPLLDNSPNSNRLQVGYVGHLYPGRGVELIIEVSKRMSKVDFHFVGGSKSDIERCKIYSEGLANVFFHGFMPPSKVAEVRSKFNVLLAPYQKEVCVSGGGGDTSKWMSPLKIFEYMSAKKIIVSSDLPVLREVLVHQYNSLLCDPEKIDDWCAAIDWIANNLADAQLIAKNAYNDFLEKYTWAGRANLITNSII